MRARVIDPAGPTWWRMATVLAGFVPAAIALTLGLVPAAALAMLAIAWVFWARTVLGRMSPREAEVVVEPGALRISAGALSQRVGARDLCAASTAIFPPGESIALVRGVAGDRPLVIEVATREDGARVRRALGVGSAGFGEMSWPATDERTDWELMATRVFSAGGWTAMAVATLAGRVELALGMALAVIPLSVIALMMTAAAAQRLVLPRATAAEREHIEAHRQAVTARAHHAQGPASMPLGPLARAHGEATRAWLERIDAMAASLVEDGGYRRGGLEPGALWDALEDPDASPVLRAIAARVLARAAPDQARLRIGGALAVERDAATRTGIRVVLEEDVELAARGLDRLERW